MARRSHAETATPAATATPAPAQVGEPEGTTPVEHGPDPQTEVFRLDKQNTRLGMAYYRRAGFPQRVALPLSHVQGSEAPVKVTILLHDDSVWTQPVALTPEKRLAALNPAARAAVQAELNRLIAEAEAK